MAQRKPKDKVTLDHVLRLVDQLSPEEQGRLRRELDASWSAEWRALLDELDLRQQARRAQFRFRRDPGAYLAPLEDKLLLLRLPP